MAANGYHRPGIEQVSAWREGTDACVLEALEIYGRFLFGQSNGISDALPLSAIESCFNIIGIDADDRADLAERILQVHGIAVEFRRKRERDLKTHG